MYLQYLIATLLWTLANVQRLSTKVIQETRFSLITTEMFPRKDLKDFVKDEERVIEGVLKNFI